MAKLELQVWMIDDIFTQIFHQYRLQCRFHICEKNINFDMFVYLPYQKLILDPHILAGPEAGPGPRTRQISNFGPVLDPDPHLISAVRCARSTHRAVCADCVCCARACGV